MIKEVTKELRKEVKALMIQNGFSRLYGGQMLELRDRYGVTLTDVVNVEGYFHYSKPQAKFRASLGE